MRTVFFLCRVLLAAVPLFAQTFTSTDPQLREEKVAWFSLDETKAAIAQSLGLPAVVAEFGSDFQSWQYQIGQVDSHEFSHLFVFRKSDGRLLSVTRNLDPERSVDTFFPDSETTAYYFPSKMTAQYSLRLRQLPGGRVLMGMGISAAGQRTGQVVLMRESELRVFYPWLYRQLHS